jgi:hypothetical protein
MRGAWTPYRWPSEIGRFSAPLVYVSRTEIWCTSPQCGHLTLSVALQAARRLCTSVSMPVGACWCVVGQVKNREDICGSFPCTGGSATGLSATDAWRRAAVGDEGRLRQIQSRVCRKTPYTYALKQRAARWCAERVRVAKCRQVPHGLAFGLDRFAAARWVIAPIRDQAPTQRVERHISGPVIAADDQQFLAGRGVLSRWIVVHAALAYLRAICKLRLGIVSECPRSL